MTWLPAACIAAGSRHSRWQFVKHMVAGIQHGCQQLLWLPAAGIAAGSRETAEGDVMERSNYKGIKLTEYGLEVLDEMVLDERLRNIINIGKHQYGFMKERGTVDAIILGSALRPLLFVLFLDVLSEGIRNEELWEFLYAEDLMTTAENEEELQRRVVELQETLEVDGLRVNVEEPEAMVIIKDGRDKIVIHESREVIKHMEV
ncbi:uncharacterized protein [Palaemon carinicauda]|uniref:uncharacterized protein n=1 Tax=Palaemon carinicauda TaxID=392227 RepID=UPI0035B6403F